MQIAIVVALLLLSGAQQTRKAPPAVGAWWHRGAPQPASAHPDLTGVWFGGTSADLSKNTVPGQELILTLPGKTVSKDNYSFEVEMLW